MTTREHRQVFVHVHVPKAAGSAFTAVLRNNFGAGFLDDNTLLQAPDMRYTADQFARLLHFEPRLRAYTSHRVSLDLPYESPEASITAIAFVRDPVSRFVSHYFWARQSRRNYSPQARELNLEQYAQTVADGKLAASAATVHTAFLDSQTAFLSGERGATGLERIRELVESRRLLLFPSERFTDAAAFLERRFPDDFSDCSQEGRVNVSRKDDEVSARARACISSIVEDDFPLHTYAQDQFDLLVAETFPNTSELESAHAALARRGRKRTRQARISQQFDLGVRFLRGAVRKFA